LKSTKRFTTKMDALESTHQQNGLQLSQNSTANAHDECGIKRFDITAERVSPIVA